MRGGRRLADYFKTLGIRIVGGRALGPRARAGAPPGGMINETAARPKFFPRRGAGSGRRIELTPG